MALPTKALGACDQFRQAHADLPVRWIAPENLHFTLLFLGSTPNDQIKEVAKIARIECIPFRSGAITLRGFRWGPPGQTPRMIWLDGETDTVFSDLKGRLRRRLSERGLYYGRDAREFAPHVTVARMEPQAKRTLPDIETPFPLPFTPKEILLIESRLSPKGATYAIVEKFPVGNRGEGTERVL